MSSPTASPLDDGDVIVFRSEYPGPKPPRPDPCRGIFCGLSRERATPVRSAGLQPLPAGGVGSEGGGADCGPGGGKDAVPDVFGAAARRACHRTGRGPKWVGVPRLFQGLAKPRAGPAGGGGRGQVHKATAIGEGLPHQTGPIPLPFGGKLSAGLRHAK